MYLMRMSKLRTKQRIYTRTRSHSVQLRLPPSPLILRSPTSLLCFTLSLDGTEKRPAEERFSVYFTMALQSVPLKSGPISAAKRQSLFAVSQFFHYAFSVFLHKWSGGLAGSQSTARPRASYHQNNRKINNTDTEIHEVA